MTPFRSVVSIAILGMGASGTMIHAQANWIQQAPATNPVQRSNHATAYHASSGRVVLFGGSVLTADTWEWNGANWLQRFASPSPSPRALHAMAADPVRATIVLFGGVTSSGFVSDTWEWDGVHWSQRNPAMSPAARYVHAMAYDSVRRRVVLFGGSNPISAVFYGDTWEWDGTIWRRLFPASAPSARYDHAMAYDPSRGRTVLFGGSDNAGIVADTWEWDGVNWVQRLPTLSPSRRQGLAMAFDSARGRVVLFGGWDGGRALADTWEWDGNNWTQRSLGTSPSGRRHLAMAHDAARGRTVIFGGNQGGTSDLGDTWEYGPVSPASVTPFGSACAGSAGVPSHVAQALPWLGDLYTLQSSNLPAPATAFLFLGFSRTNWGTIPLPLDLTLAGLTGCSLLTEIPVLLFSTGPGGSVNWTLPIPTGADLLGFGFFTQSLHIDPLANPFGATLSNGLAHTIGGR